MTGASVVVGLVAVLVTEALKRCGLGRRFRLDDLGAAVCVSVAVLGSVAAGAVLPRLFPELPADLESWRAVGMQAGAGAVTAYNLWSKRLRSRAAR